VRLGSGVSNAKKIAVDVPIAASRLRISGLSDGTSWKPGVLDLSRGPVDFVSPGVSGAPRQVNIEVPPEVPDGDLDLEILLGSIRSAPAEVRITR
jgi:hypothetical protein